MKRDRPVQPNPAPAASRVDKIVSPTKFAQSISTSLIAQAAALRQPPQKVAIVSPTRGVPITVASASLVTSSIASPLPVAGTVSISADVDALLGGKQAGSLYDVLTRKHSAKPPDNAFPQKQSSDPVLGTASPNSVSSPNSQPQRLPTPPESKVVLRAEVAISELISKAIASSALPLSPEGHPPALSPPKQQTGLPSGESETVASPITPRQSVPQPQPQPLHPPPVSNVAVAPPPVPLAPARNLGPIKGPTVAEGPKKPSLVGSGASNQPPPPSGSVRVDTVPVNLPESFLSTNLLAGTSVVSAPDGVREAPASALTLAEPEPHDVHASTSPQSPSDAQIIAAKAASDLLASVSARVDAENGVDGDAQITEGVSGEEQFVYSIATFAGISEQGGLWSTSG